MISLVILLLLLIFGVYFGLRMISKKLAERWLKGWGNLVLAILRVVGEAVIHLASRYPVIVGITVLIGLALVCAKC